MDRKEEKKRFRQEVIELENRPGAIPDSHSAVYTDALQECRYIFKIVRRRRKRMLAFGLAYGGFA